MPPVQVNAPELSEMPRVKVDRRSRDQRKRAARTRAVEIVAERAIQKQRAAEDAEAAADARGGGFRAGDDDDEEGWRTGQISVIDAEAMKGDWNGLWKDALARPAIAKATFNLSLLCEGTTCDDLAPSTRAQPGRD